MIKKINLESKMLPHRRHINKLKIWSKTCQSGYRVIMSSLISELESLLKQEKLIKSQGWSDNVNIVKLPLSDKISKVIDRHLSALRWILIGKNAGPEAIRAAKLTGVYNKITPGVLVSAYMDSLDTDRAYFEGMYMQSPEEISNILIKKTVENISDHATRYMDQLIPQIKNSLLYSIENIQESLNYKNLAIAQTVDTQSEINEKTSPYAARYKLKQELRMAAVKSGKKWNLGASSELGKASAVGSHQALVEVFGQSSDNKVKVVWLVAERENNCTFCTHTSKNADGTFKYYNLKDFKPSGYNYGRKQAEWELTIPPVHPNCYCRLVYVPPGFTVTKDGDIIPISL